MARLLLDHGADPNDGGGEPLLDDVCYRKPDEVRLLLSRGADPNTRGWGGITALRGGIGCGRIAPDSVRALLEYGADVNARDSSGVTPLRRALQARSPRSIIAILRQAGARE